jgi:hypothetical protein
VTTLVLLIERRIGLKVGAGQIVQQHLEAHVEQVPPALGEMTEQGTLVLEQPVVATVEHMRGGEAIIRAKQIGERRAPVPLPMQPPLTARRNEPIGREHKQHQIPARALA